MGKEKVKSTTSSFRENIRNHFLKEELSGIQYLLGLSFLIFASSFFVVIILNNLNVFYPNVELGYILIIIVSFFLFGTFFFKASGIKKQLLGLFFLVFSILFLINNLTSYLSGLRIKISLETIMLGYTLSAILFTLGETRRGTLETHMTNRLSYLPGLVLYYKGSDLYIKNIGKRAALNPTLIEVELESEKEIGKPFPIPGLLDAKEESEVPILMDTLDRLGISKLRNGQFFGIKIKFDSPYDNKTSPDELNHFTIQILEGESKIIKFKKASWHADYRR